MTRNTRFSITALLLVWLAAFAGSGAIWFALAYNPEWLLYVERRQPAASYDYAQELLRDERIEEALRAYDRGIAYFEGIYRESGMERHRLQVARGLLGKAHIHMYHTGERGLPEAERLYREAIALYPHWAGGQPYYSLGITLNRLGKYAEAEANFDLALERGHGRVEVELVYFGRGLARARQGQLDAAARDWYIFLRYAGRGPYPDEQRAIDETPLRDASAPEALFIRGLTLMRQGDPDGADLLQHYREMRPDDPAAQFYVGQAPSAVGEIDLAHCYPYRDERPYPFLDARIDLYPPEPGLYEIALTLSGVAPGADPPVVEARINNHPHAQFTVRGAAPERHSLTLELPAGRVILQLRETWPEGRPIQAELLLHDISVSGER